MTTEKGFQTDFFFHPKENEGAFQGNAKILHFISKKQLKLLKKAGISFNEKKVTELISDNKSGILANGKTPYLIIEENEEIINKCFNKSSEEMINLITTITREKIGMQKKIEMEVKEEIKKEGFVYLEE